MKRRWLLRAASAAVLIACGALGARADFLVQYEMAGQPGSQATTAATFAAVGASGVNLARGPGLTPSDGNNSMNSSGWVGPAADDFYSLGFDVIAGSRFLVTDLTFATRSSATGPGFVNVLYAVDGGPETLITTLTQGNATFLNSQLTLTAAVTVQSSFRVLFRAANNTAANGGTIAAAGTLRIGDYSPDGGGTFQPITVGGRAIAVPEPAGLILLGMGVIGLAWIRHRIGNGAISSRLL